MPLFPETKPDLLDPDEDLQRAFDEAMATHGTGLGSVPLVIVALEESEPHGFAAQLETEVHYSASLLKATGMWAAFELRRAANEFVSSIVPTPDPDAVLAMLSSAFDDVINESRVAQLASVNLDGFLLPRWPQVFQVDPADSTVNFSPAFFGKLFDAIADGNNAAAGEVVHGLGFGYLTQAAASAEFFDEDAAAEPKTADGMWLCGDFGHGFPPQRIPCVNDTPVAQATSALQMARLFTFLAASTVADNTPLVGAVSDVAMRDLLFRAVERLHLFLNRDTAVGFVTTQSKIGLGPLNNGTTVASEAAIIQENATGRRFVVVFQNKSFVNDASLVPVSQVVDATIASFLFP